MLHTSQWRGRLAPGCAEAWMSAEAAARPNHMGEKKCFLNNARPCDLTCKAAFEVDDPVDNVDCYFIWLAHHFGESLYEVRRIFEGMGGLGFPTPPGATGGSGGPGEGGPSGGSGGPSPPKGPKGFPHN